MKKVLFTFLGLFVAATIISAQTISLQPIPASANNDTLDDVAVDAVIHNLTNTTLNMKWERQVIEITPGCETAVCDVNTCWARHIGNRAFDLEPNQEGDMLVHFYRNGAPCQGIVHVKITNLNNPADTTIGVYLFNMNSDVKDLPVANVKLFPNPVSSFFSLDNAQDVAAIRIFSLDSRLVARFDATQGNNTYNVQHLATGNYVIALEDKNGRTFQALEFNKY